MTQHFLTHSIYHMLLPLLLYLLHICILLYFFRIVRAQRDIFNFLLRLLLWSCETPLWIPFMRVCALREASPVQAGGVSFMVTSSTASYLHHPLPHHLSLFISVFLFSLHSGHFSPIFLAAFFSLFLHQPPTCLPSLLHKTQGSLHRWFIFTHLFSLCLLLLSADVSLILSMLNNLIQLMHHAVKRHKVKETGSGNITSLFSCMEILLLILLLI